VALNYFESIEIPFWNNFQSNFFTKLNNIIQDYPEFQGIHTLVHLARVNDSNIFSLRLSHQYDIIF